MLFSLKDNRRRRDIGFLSALNPGISTGSGVPPTPAKFPNLSVWYKNDMSVVGSVLVYNDDLNPGDGLQGAFSVSVPNREIQQLNGLNVLNYLTSTAVQFITNLNVPYNEIFLTGDFTLGCILKQSSNTAGRSCHSKRGSGLPGFFTVGQFQQGVSGNKLSYFLRSFNAQSVTLNSITDWNGAGWQIVFIVYNDATKTLTMYENGNTISGTNALMDTFVFQSPGRVYSFQTNGLNTIGGWWIGGLGEFFYYSDAKNVATINKLGKYLQLRYAIPWTAV